MSLVEDGRLGKYVVIGTLGRGAMGTVYDARDPVIDRRVAIKTIPLASAEDEEGVEALARFKREAQAAGRLQHPNLVGVYDYGETDTLAYIVMEFVDGTSLKAVLDKQERFTPADTARIMEQVLAGLQYSHARGVVHRDIKPANIMLTGDGVVKIADFGIARIESSSLTQAGTIMGTPAYMSPEQFMGTTVDARTDIYSSGVMLYQMLTGERPFEGSMTGIMHKALNTEPPAPSAISVTSPVGLDAVVAKAMAKRPEQRFADAAAFAAALRAGLTAPALEDSEATMVAVPAKRPPAPEVAPSPAAPPSRGRLGLLAGLGLAALAVTGAAAFLVLRPAKPPTTALAQPQTVLPPPPMPQHAPPATTAPVAAPPVANPPVDPLKALASALAGADCSLVQATLAGHTIQLSGIVGWDHEQALEQAITQAAPGSMVASRPDVFRGPYCGIANLLRPLMQPLAPDGTFAVGLVDTKGQKIENAALKNDEPIIPHLVTPATTSYLTVDYFSSDGTVLHIFPRSKDRIKAFAPSSKASFGLPGYHDTFPVSPPFGTDVLVAIATQRPLFARPRPDDDDLKDYMASLRKALAGADNAPIMIRSIVVHTAKN
jgi:serine/threonine-protein kinase